MRVFVIIILSLFYLHIIHCQSPLDAPLPEKFDGLQHLVDVNNFPSPVSASLDPDEPGIYFWKHNTVLLSTHNDVEISEGGAYIYYNDQWNLRVAMKAKEFCKLFHVPKCKMKPGQPYTFSDNWRRDSRLRGGWAMWYVIGVTSKKEKVYGISILHTTEELLKHK